MKFLLMKVFLHLLMVLLIGLLIGCEGYHNSDLTPNKETDDVGFNTTSPATPTPPLKALPFMRLETIHIKSERIGNENSLQIKKVLQVKFFNSID